MKPIELALTYDDVLIVPKRSSLKSRSEADTRTKITKKIGLNVPIVSANMDTVTESEMAIAMARLGGIGIIHRFMTIEENVEEIKRVKRAQNLIIKDPYNISKEKTVAEAREIHKEKNISGLVVTDNENHLLGLITRRDLLFINESSLVKDVMTPRERIIVGNAETTFEEAKQTMTRHKIEKLPLVDAQNMLVGFITMGDIQNLSRFPNANVDARGQLIVGGSIGVYGDYLERAQELVKAGVDMLVIDIAHGHSDVMFDAIPKIREVAPTIQLMAGNIATADAARELCEAGIDAIKVGVGPGTTCVTRLVTGCGVPQLTAIMHVAQIAHEYGVPINADGGIQKSGDIVKAIGAGADSVMLGGAFSGVKESPGIIMMRGDKRYKVCRGSASFAVAQRRKIVAQEKKKLSEVTPEGTESIVPYKGELANFFGQLVGGLRSGMSYTNSRTISDLQKNVTFMRITDAGRRESGPHDLEEVK